MIILLCGRDQCGLNALNPGPVWTGLKTLN